MTFVRNVIGGIIIMAVATGIGVAHNAVRSKPIALFPKLAAPPGSTTPGAKAASPANTEPHPASAAAITMEEYAAGELAMDRVRAVTESGLALIIDARSESEFAEGHLPGAVNIPYEKFMEYTGDLETLVPMDSPVICYCRSVTCDLSDQLAQELRLMGYDKVILYRGGWDEWLEAGLPTEGGDEE